MYIFSIVHFTILLTVYSALITIYADLYNSYIPTIHGHTSNEIFKKELKCEIQKIEKIIINTKSLGVSFAVVCLLVYLGGSASTYEYTSIYTSSLL